MANIIRRDIFWVPTGDIINAAPSLVQTANIIDGASLLAETVATIRRANFVDQMTNIILKVPF